MRLLAQTTAARSPSLPDVPTYQEAGIKGWCSTNGSASSCPPERRRPSSPASTPRSTRRSPRRRSAKASCNRRRSRSAAAPSSSRASSATISRSTSGWCKELNIKAANWMKLTDEEEALRAGEFGPAAQWAIEHQIKVGEYLGAADFVPVTQAHIMADTESLGVAGVEWLERMARPAGGPAAGPHSDHHRSARHRLRGRASAQAAALDARPRAPRHRRVRGARRADDRHLHQLPDHHAAGARRARRLWRHRRGDLFEQRVRRALEFRGRTVGAERRAHRPHAALRLSPRRAARGDARRQRRAGLRASSTTGARSAGSSAAWRATIGRCRRSSASIGCRAPTR